MKTIYFDMDGVLAEWDSASSIEDTFQKNYFLERKPDANAIGLFLCLKNRGYDVKVLSCAYENDYAVPEKKQWLMKYVGEGLTTIFVPYGKNKNDFAPPGILIDDYTKNLKEWELHGGIGIKYYNQVNGNHGTWKGYAIDSRTDGRHLADLVVGVADKFKLERTAALPSHNHSNGNRGFKR